MEKNVGRSQGFFSRFQSSELDLSNSNFDQLVFKHLSICGLAPIFHAQPKHSCSQITMLHTFMIYPYFQQNTGSGLDYPSICGNLAGSHSK